MTNPNSPPPANPAAPPAPPATPPASKPPETLETPPALPPETVPPEPPVEENPAARRLKAENDQLTTDNERLNAELEAMNNDRPPWRRSRPTAPPAGAPEDVGLPGQTPADGGPPVDPNQTQDTRAVVREELHAYEVDRNSDEAWRWVRSQPEAKSDKEFRPRINAIIKQYCDKESDFPWREANMVLEIYHARHGTKAVEEIPAEALTTPGPMAPGTAPAPASQEHKAALLARMRANDKTAYEEYSVLKDQGLI